MRQENYFSTKVDTTFAPGTDDGLGNAARKLLFQQKWKPLFQQFHIFTAYNITAKPYRTGR
ncbi:MAG: hypothetical protein ACC634_03550 [Hyphomicrobiales bacterium]